MKRTILIIAALIFMIVVIAQENKKFEYTKTQFGNYVVTPVFNSSKGEGIRGLPVWSDQDYINKLISSTLKKVIPKDKLEKLHLGSGFKIIFDQKGDILNCSFIIASEDFAIITDKDLYDLYHEFMKIKIDMNKVKIEPVLNTTNVKEVDYAEIGGSLLPLEYRKK